MWSGRLTRRSSLAAGLAGGVALVGAHAARARGADGFIRYLDFRTAGDGDGWPGWRCPGVANLRRADGLGRLEAGSDVFPCDPRPVAFALDQRFRDGEVAARFAARTSGAGLVVRRTGPRSHYAAVVDDDAGALVLLRRSPAGSTELARTPLVLPDGPFTLVLQVDGAGPTRLRATVGRTTVAATDDEPALQRAGDPGVLATARTVFPSAGPAALPALGNVRLLPYGVQEGQAFLDTAVGRELLALIRRRSTAVVEEVVVRGEGPPGRTPASVVAATTGVPARLGATVRVACDTRARVQVEVARDPAFRRARRTPWRLSDDLGALQQELTGLPPGARVHWRARVRRRGRVEVGPARSFRVPPLPGDGAPVRLAIGSCAAQFGPIFALIEDRRPDVFLWQGDLNYPDTAGPLMQTVPGYAGFWRDFLANPQLEGIFARTAFAAQRDDHDYGLQDAARATLVPWGLTPWEALVERRTWYRFAAGLCEVWVLDQRRFKDDPAAPDTAEKSLLGPIQRSWLLRTLRSSRAPFKVVCSPCTLAPLPANARDGSWAAGFTAERDLLLRHVHDHVSGTTVFVTGDTHWTMVYEDDGLLEVRPCPLGIPTPNDITLVDPQAAESARRVPGVRYADDDRGHVAILDVRREDGRPRLDIALLRDDGTEPWRARLDG